MTGQDGDDFFKRPFPDEVYGSTISEQGNNSAEPLQLSLFVNKGLTEKIRDLPNFGQSFLHFSGRDGLKFAITEHGLTMKAMG